MEDKEGNSGALRTTPKRDCAHAQSVTCHFVQEANYYGSLTQASTTSLGIGQDGKDVHIPVKDLLPMLDPNEIEWHLREPAPLHSEQCRRSLSLHSLCRSQHPGRSMLPFAANQEVSPSKPFRWLHMHTKTHTIVGYMYDIE